MSTAAEVLRLKGFEVVTIRPENTVLEAAREMNLRRIGALVVVDERGGDGAGGGLRQVVGMFTERDVLMRVVAAERDPRTTRVGDVMTPHVVYCTRRTPLAELKNLMRHRRIRHIPVLDDGRLVGLISIGDLNAFETESLMQTITVLEEYITRG
jgi:CBS domain-containing protein